MIEFENTIRIQRPVQDVYAFVADFENVPKWNYYVVSVNKLTERPVGEGVQYHQIRKDDQQRFEVTEYRPNEVVTVETTPESQPRFKRRLVFVSANGGTTITDTWELELNLNPLLQWLGASKVKSAVAENLGKLKELLETGQTQLQDGRIAEV